MIEQITPAQEALMPLYVAKYTAIGLDTSPTDRAKAIEAARNLCDLSPRKPANGYIEMIVDKAIPGSVEHYNATDTQEGQIAIVAGPFSTIKELIVESGLSMQSAQVFAQHAAATPAFYKFMVDVLGVAEHTKPEDLVVERTEALHNFSVYCGLVYDFENCIFVCDKPLEHKRLPDGKYEVIWG